MRTTTAEEFDRVCPGAASVLDCRTDLEYVACEDSKRGIVLFQSSQGEDACLLCDCRNGGAELFVELSPRVPFQSRSSSPRWPEQPGVDNGCENRKTTRDAHPVIGIVAHNQQRPPLAEFSYNAERYQADA